MRARLWMPLVGMVVGMGWLGACAPPPKQAEVPDDTRETGMEGTPAAAADPAALPSEGPPAKEAAEMKAKCCVECKQGLAKDRSGSDPKTVPCADYTDTLSPWCLEFFRGTPTMAAACNEE